MNGTSARDPDEDGAVALVDGRDRARLGNLSAQIAKSLIAQDGSVEVIRRGRTIASAPASTLRPGSTAGHPCPKFL
jgi:hypothetical protein